MTLCFRVSKPAVGRCIERAYGSNRITTSMASWASKSWEPQGMSIGEVPVHPMGDQRVGSPPQTNGNGFNDFCYVHLEIQGNDANLIDILEMGSNHQLEKKIGFGWFRTSVRLFQEHPVWWNIQISLHLNWKGFVEGKNRLRGLMSAHALHTIGVGVIFHMTYFYRGDWTQL